MGKFGMSAAATGISEPITAILFTFAGIALYNTIELLVLILITFKRFRGLYFWSLLIAAIGILPYTLGLLFKFFNVITNNWASVTLIVIGWHTMVTGQSIVMYSRLHLVTSNRKLLRAVLGMIIVNWFISNVPITVVVYGIQSAQTAKYVHIYGVWERLQVCLYAAQESIIAILYIIQIAKMLRIDTGGHGTGVRRGSNFSGKPRRIMIHLIWVNILIIALDITLLAVEFAGYYQIQVLYKGALYSCKLKMEFWILNQLTVISSHKLRQAQDTFTNDEVYGTANSTTVAPPNTVSEKKFSSAGVTISSVAPERPPLGMRRETEPWNTRRHERNESSSSSDDIWLGKQPPINDLEQP